MHCYTSPPRIPMRDIPIDMTLGVILAMECMTTAVLASVGRSLASADAIALAHHQTNTWQSCQDQEE